MENEETKEKPKEDSSPTMVSSAHEAAKKLQEQNQRMEENIKRLEELKAFETLGGKSEGASQQEAVKQDISDEEYSNKALSGDVEEQ